MEEPRTVSRSDKTFDGDDEFYERIEAPKFVDFTVPDQYIPDDRAWFCSRLGCNQEHTEDMDPDTIYKNFVLRVMAARSPNVKLRKALSKNRTSQLSKCPLSAPPKSSRMPRLAVMASISQKIGENKVKVPLVSRFKPTPSNAKVKQSILVTKALTTPRNKRPPMNPEPFRSTRKPDSSTMKLNNSQVVKALVFGSPKKADKETLDGNDIPIKAVGTEMKKLKRGSQRKYVPSRYATSLNLSKPQSKPHGVRSNKTQDCKPDRKGKKKEDAGLQKKCQTVQNGTKKGSSGEKMNDRTVKCCRMEENKEQMPVEKACTSKAGSPKRNVDENNSEEKHPTLETNHGTVANTESRKSHGEGSTAGNASIGVTFPEEQGLLPSSKEFVITEPVENSKILQKKRESPRVAAEQKETMEVADKENTSAFDNNRDLNLNIITEVKKTTQKGVLGTQKKVLKEGASACMASDTNYKKTKPTNPKPFRLRTDERGILKEANSEKRKLRLAAREGEQTLTSKLCKHRGGQSEGTGSQSVNCQGQPSEGNQISSHRITKKMAVLKSLRGDDGRKATRVDKKVKLEGKELVSQKLKHTPSCSRGRLGSITESATISKPHKTTEGAGKSRSISRGKRPSTVPKEPNFHQIHVPKSCTKKSVPAT
ncbi:hypothetical protein H6P81_020823 [Aristolochia fimbriata]|uniref:Uncharacterized protein n=1 Tax=Aristolochia fimbriata TaxID=158543 RepID=A0AAV7DZR7_ARIFI|nr:hypothetical protein H6P81_020823 [Aristolochia fimbriata]